MPTSLPQIDFRRIRQHESSQPRAWEELSYLLTPDIAELPPGTPLERRAAPDSGIEFSCPAPPGKGRGRWAWQAKFLFRLDGSAFSQMTRSVDDALDTTPDLKRYTFILPVDRSARRPPRGKSGLQKWDEHVARWEAYAAARRMKIRFDYIGHSDIVVALQAQKHAGALRYFFEETLLTDEFFRQQVGREIANLGERYDPAVHVDLEIGGFFDALSRSPRFVRRIVDGFSEIVRWRHSLHGAPKGDGKLTEAVREADNEVREVVAAAHAASPRIAAPDVMVFAELATTIRACGEKMAAVETAVALKLDRLRQEETRATPRVHDTKPRRGERHRLTSRSRSGRVEARRKALYDFEAGLWRLRSAVDEALHLVTCLEVAAAERAVLLLDGPAGCGKSHLVADIAKERVEQGLPTLLLLGQHLTAGAIWPQLARSIDVDLTGQELLQVLEVAAQIRGSRALIVVDAINDGAGAELWPEQLPGFLQDIAAHPWVAVALTIRDTYNATVLPPNLPSGAVVRVTHPGLLGHEEEALTRYTEHYRLRLPDVPPLLPELTNPLFLRSLCRSVEARGLTSIPREAASLAWVFSGLIDAVNRRLSRQDRLDVDPADELVGRAMAALAGAMLDADNEALPVATAKAICEGLYPELRRSKSLFDGLVAEGLLLREEIREGDDDDSPRVDRVRFTYQRLADHLRAEALLARNTTSQALISAVKMLATGEHAWSRVGLIEALVVLVPEHRGAELATLLRLGPQRSRSTPAHRRRPRSPTSVRREWLRQVLGRSFFNSLLWRDPRSINDKTRDLANRYLETGAISDYEWLTLLLSLACVPDHPLNVRLIDRALRGMTMPERDIQWSDEILGVWSEDNNPIARTIDWAWSGSESPPADVTHLAATLLGWLLTSPNRRLRDTATKALLRLVEHRTRLLVDLLDAFADVDDAYIIDRLLAVANGHVIRHRHLTSTDEFLDDLARLGRRVFDLVFGGPDVPEHLLIRHYARTCVELVNDTLAAHGRHFDRDVGRVKPPYGSSWPLTAPSVRELARRYGRKSSRYVASATELDFDFVEYVIERGIATDFALPNQRRRRAARRTAAKRRANALRTQILRSLSARQRSQVAKQIDDLLASDDGAHFVSAGWDAVRAAVPPRLAAAVDELSQVGNRLRFDDRPVQPNPRLLSRWIGNRVIELGWTQTRFGTPDSMLARARNARWSETERFGKKYTWIAFYQLLGHLADHCALQREWRDSHPERYEGPWQISQAPDIDPTLLLRGDEPPEGSTGARLRRLRVARERDNAWWLEGYHHKLRTSGLDADWLNDLADIPRPEGLLTIRDPRGNEWLVLESHVTWRVADDDPGPYNRDRRQLWVRTQANLVQAAEEDRVGRWAAERNWMGLWMPTPSDYLSGPLGGYPDLPPWPTMLALVDHERRLDAPAPTVPGPDWETVRRQDGTNQSRFLIALATSAYHRETDRDFSASDVPWAILPSRLLLSLLGARLVGPEVEPCRELGLGPVETEYAWQASGEVVAFASAGRDFDSTSMFCVRANTLRRALAEAGLGLWCWVLGEKIYWTVDEPSTERTDIFAALSMTSAIEIWGMTAERRGWRNRTEVRKRLLAERPLTKQRK